MAALSLHYGPHAPTSSHSNEWLEPYFGNACCPCHCPHHCPYRNLNSSFDASGLPLGTSHVGVWNSGLENLPIFSDANFIQLPTFNVELSNAQSYMNTSMGLSSDPTFSTQQPLPISPQVESWLNAPYLTVEGDNGNPLSDATLATTSLPFDLSPDVNLAGFADEALTTPSSTASEGPAFQVCDICLKPLKPSDIRRHKKTHLKRHHCPMVDCFAAFSEKKDLRRHKATKHGIDAAIFYCGVVGCEWQFKGFSRRDTLTRHMKKMHRNLVQSETTPPLYGDHSGGLSIGPFEMSELVL